MENVKDPYDYKYGDVISYIVRAGLNKKGRQRGIIDRRKYVSLVLFHKFNISYTEIASCLNQNHASVIYAVRTCKEIMNDPQFKQHTEYVRKIFPVSEKDLKEKKEKKVYVSIALGKEDLAKLRIYRDTYNLPSYKTALRMMVKNI
jgi:hypothetical protein